MNFSSKRVNVV